jgi:hypothetical protein
LAQIDRLIDLVIARVCTAGAMVLNANGDRNDFQSCLPAYPDAWRVLLGLWRVFLRKVSGRDTGLDHIVSGRRR